MTTVVGMAMAEQPNRIPLVGDDTDDPAVTKTFDYVRSAVARIPNLYRTLAHSPEVLDGWLAFAWPLRHAAQTDRSVRELIIMRTAQLTGADYEWRQHHAMATDAGVTAAQLGSLGSWPSSDAFSAAERVALGMTDELSATAELGDDTWTALRGVYGERECVELVMTAAFYQCVSRVLGGLAVPLEADVDGVPAIDPAARSPHLGT
jgi:4-carboxymuconolactone decarboxylase